MPGIKESLKGAGSSSWVGDFCQQSLRDGRQVDTGRQLRRLAFFLCSPCFLFRETVVFNKGGFEVLGCRTVAAVRSWVTHGH